MGTKSWTWKRRGVALALLLVATAAMAFAQIIVAVSQWYGWELRWLQPLRELACRWSIWCELGFVRYVTLALAAVLVAGVAFFGAGRGLASPLRAIAVEPAKLGPLDSRWAIGLLSASLGVQLAIVSDLMAAGQLPSLGLWAAGLALCGAGLLVWEVAKGGISDWLTPGCYLVGYVLALVGVTALGGRCWELATGAVVAATGLLIIVWRRLAASGASMGPWVGLLVIGLATLGAGLYRLDSWRFGMVGDEWAFFMAAVRLQVGKWLQPLLSGHGNYGIHPVFSSWLQMLTMGLFGQDNYGWRALNPLVAALSVLPMYTIGRALASRRVGLVAAALFGGSHYLMAFGKIGYNNVQALVPVLAAVAIWFEAGRRGSVTGLWLAGVAAGLGFYVFGLGRLVILAILALMILYYGPWRRENLLAWGAVALGFGMAALPSLLEPGNGTSLVQQTVLHSTYAQTAEEMLRQVRDNSLRAMLAFFTSGKHTHFVFGAHLDPLTSSLMWWGVVVLLMSLRRRLEGWILLAAWLGAAMALGGLTQYDHPPNTRMFLLLPLYALIAALGLERMGDLASRVTRWRPARHVLAVVVLMAAWGMNAYIAYVVFPTRRALTQECLLLRELMIMDQLGPDSVPLLVVRSPGDRYDLISYLLRAYELDGVRVGVTSVQQVAAGLEAGGCTGKAVRLWHPSQVGELDQLERLLTSRCRRVQVDRLYDLSGTYHYTQFQVPLLSTAFGDTVYWIEPWAP